MENNYAKAYKELVEILNNVPQESVNRIPVDMIEMFKHNMDNNYNFKIDVTKSFENQVLMEETKAILANIYKDYWATPYQKERINEKERIDREILEKEKAVKYNPDELFNNKKELKEENYSENLPIEIKKENFFKKLITLIKSFFIK